MSNTAREVAIEDYRNSGQCFDYECHSVADFEYLLDFVRQSGYAVVGPLKCRGWRVPSAPQNAIDRVSQRSQRPCDQNPAVA